MPDQDAIREGPPPLIGRRWRATGEEARVRADWRRMGPRIFASGKSGRSRQQDQGHAEGLQEPQAKRLKTDHAKVIEIV